MDFEKPISVQWLADYIGAEVHGNQDIVATGINEIHKVRQGDITFVDVEKYYKKCLESPASIVIINKEVAVPAGKALLVVKDPFSAYNSITKRFRPFAPNNVSIAESASIGDSTVIQPGVIIGNDCVIGDNCIIHANVTIYDHTVIGDRVIIHSGAVIGSEAFYYKSRQNRDVKYEKMHSCGRVIIEDDVEIGANTTIDKGVSGDTIIGKGTKIDNLVHVGHGVVIGKDCLIAAQVGIAGKTVLEDGVILWGQVGVNKSLTIGKGAVVYAQSGVPSSIEGGKTYFGSPVDEARTKMKELALMKRLNELIAKK